MKRPPATRQTQLGIALVALLVLLIMAGAYAFYRSANFNFGRSQQDQKLQLRLAQAKEALIAYAVIDKNRPGRLLCPDLIGDGISPLLSRDDCDAYIGWLPWKTLDLGDATDDHGTKLRYVALRWFGGDRTKPPLNSDTLSTIQLAEASITPSSLESTPLGTLYLDIPIGSGTDATDLKNDIVALIIAPRGELDARNADGDHYFFSGNSSSNADNDIIMPVTRQELMAAVEKRVASEVKACLEQHAVSPTNSEQYYPWPAPLASSAFRGNAGSLFGQLPATQPGAGPENQVKKSTTDLTNAKTALASASTATEQLVALQVLNDTVAQAGTLYDKLYIVASALAQTAKDSQLAFYGLNTAIDIAANSGLGISRTERTALRDDAKSVKDKLVALQAALADSGIDAFPGELLRRKGALRSAIDAVSNPPTPAELNAIAARASDFSTLYSRSTTRNPDIGVALNAALASTNAAQSAAANAVASPGDTTLVTAAINGAKALLAATVTLHDTIQPTVNLSASEIQLLTLQVSDALADFAAQPSAEGAAGISARLSKLRVLLDRLTSDSNSVLAMRNNALAAIDSALVAANAANDFILIQISTNAAFALTYDLARTVAGSRINLPASEVSAQADRTAALLTAFNARRDAETAATLASGLTALQTLVNTLVTNSSLVVAARSATLVSTASALTTAKAAADFTAIDAQTILAISNAMALSSAMANNGDNVPRESLAAAAGRYETVQAVFNVITPPRPVQANMIPYAVALQAPAIDIGFWSELTAINATEIATLARKAPTASASSENTASAYYAANQALVGMAGSGGSLAALQAYVNAPTNSTRQAAAATALAATAAQVDSLLTRATALDTALDSGSAEAFPTLWYGNACAFLQPPSGSSSWWTANNWANTTFYQIGDRVRPAIGKLTVNGSDTKYRVVVVSAGRVLPGQDITRNTRKATQFLEGINADTNAPGAPGALSTPGARDGMAQNPPTAFSSAPVSNIFNDRLAY